MQQLSAEQQNNVRKVSDFLIRSILISISIDTKLNESMRIITGTLRLTPLAWLPVLANIASPALRRQILTAAFMQSAVVKDLPVQSDIINHPGLRLISWHSIWQSSGEMDVNKIWRDAWAANPVVNSVLIDDSQPRFQDSMSLADSGSVSTASELELEDVLLVQMGLS